MRLVASVHEFSGRGAPEIDFVFTVCDNAARETCPVWPGHPVTAHWGIPDPASVEGSEEEKLHAFEIAYGKLETRIGAFIALPLEELDEPALKSELEAIGRLMKAEGDFVHQLIKRLWRSGDT